MEFAQRLKELRNKKKISQTELGKLVGLHYTQIGRYERGGSMPSSEVLKKLAEVLEVSTDFLMDGTTEEAAKYQIHDKEFLKQFLKIEQLDSKDKEVIKILIDAFLTKKQIQQLAK